MKKINFIKPVPEKQSRELILWLIVTAGTLIIIASVLLIYSISTLRLYHSLHKQRMQLEHQLSEFETLSATYRNHMQEKELIEKQAIQFKKKINNRKNPLARIQLISGVNVPDVEIQSLSLQKKQITIEGFSVHPSQVVAYIEELKKNDQIKTVRLNTVHPGHKAEKQVMIFNAYATVY